MALEELPGFGIPTENNEESRFNHKKNPKKSGGFQSMGFNYPIMKGITKRGYKLPTPIQRKTIPLILSGRDVVAMARTGSGKTACFVLPILEKLSSDKKVTPGRNLRALVFSPTRELALQTLRFFRDLGRFTGLRAASALGGDSMDEQFSLMSGVPPDILVATPGRLLHLLVEMNAKLNDLQMLVFDEADRLFELGFEEQMRELMARMPLSRQTLLFSATLPRNLVDFARAGLQEPALLRLNADWKLPKQLSLAWISVRDEQRTAALLVLLDRILVRKRKQAPPQAIVFTATKHHVEYIQLVLIRAGISCAGVHSGLDSSARKVALGRFSVNRATVLVVTDVAARGLDLPTLQYVINYQLPATPKLFVHRAGRTARASAAGIAYSLVAPVDGAYLLDLELFLGAKINNVDNAENEIGENNLGFWGSVPTDELDVQHANVLQWNDQPEIGEAYHRGQNAWQKYMRCREAASPHSNKRAKHLHFPILPHPIFTTSFDQSVTNEGEQQQQQLVAKIHTFKPRGTIFELGGKNDSPDYAAMKAKRIWSEKAIKTKMEHDTQIEDELKEVLHNKKPKKRKSAEISKDPNYIPHQPDDVHTETGLSVNFAVAARGASLDMRGDEDGRFKSSKTGKFGDNRNKRRGEDVQTIIGESGMRVPATLRSGRFQQWKKRQGADDAAAPPEKANQMSEFRPNWVKHYERIAKQKALKESGELRSTQQVLKERMRKEKIEMKQKRGKKKGSKRKH